MAQLSRYTEGIGSHGGLTTAKAVQRIRNAISSGRISTFERSLKQGERLDQIAADQYGDSRLWWVIAAASNIGWWMQVPAGTRIVIPVNLGDVEREM